MNIIACVTNKQCITRRLLWQRMIQTTQITQAMQIIQQRIIQMKLTALVRKIQQKTATKPVIHLTIARTANKYLWAGLRVCPFVTKHIYYE